MTKEKQQEQSSIENSEEKEVSIDSYKAKFEELEQKQANLNQGIAKYRDDAQNANKRAEDLESKVTELESRFNNTSTEKIDSDDAAMLESWARNKGFVTKEEISKLKQEQVVTNQKQVEEQAVNSFLKKYPQYNTNDNWEKIQKEFKESFRPQQTIQGYSKILEKIHQLLSISDAEARGGNKVRAQLTNNSRLSLGGGNQSTPNEETTIDDLQKKYPSLSKEQISTRLNEIKSLKKSGE